MTESTGGARHPAGCLAVIDMQRVFAEPGIPWLTPRFAEVVGPVRQLADAFQPHVVFTRFVAPDKPQGVWRRYYEMWPFALEPPHAPIYQLVDELAPGAGETIDLTTFSKWGPELASRVELADGGPLVLAGVSTDCCVLSTAVAAADAGVEVQVVAEACAGLTDDSHREALDIMQLYAPLIEVVSLAEVLGGPPSG